MGPRNERAPSEEIRAAGSRAGWLLALGATVGLALAAAEIVAPGNAGTALPATAVARVGEQTIPRSDYDRAVEALSRDRRSPLDDEERRRVLDRLIDEELLVQRGIDLGLVRSDARVRSDLVSAVIDAVSSEASAQEPSAAEIARFYAENGDLFARAGRVRARQILVRITPDRTAADARSRAELAAARLRDGEPFVEVAAELGDAEITPLPDTPLPPGKLREYLGPTATRAVLELAPGTINDPVQSSAGFHVLEVLERDGTTLPPLDEIEPQVRAEIRRRNGDRALRTYLDDLRSRARIETARGIE